MNYTMPEEILAVDTEELAAFIAKNSRNRLSMDKAEEIKSAAECSFGIDPELDAFRIQWRPLLQQIRFTGGQLDSPDVEIEKRLKKG